MYKIIIDKKTKKVITIAKVTSKFVGIGYNKDNYELAEVETLPASRGSLYYENGEVIQKS